MSLLLQFGPGESFVILFACICELERSEENKSSRAGCRQFGGTARSNREYIQGSPWTRFGIIIRN
jgi:hypothetical protein